MASNSNATLYGQELGPMIAQAIICAYPISDLFAPTPRYLYYALLILIFLLPRYTWVTNVFLGAAVAYAATAAIDTFIVVAGQTGLPTTQAVTIPMMNVTSDIPDDTIVNTSLIHVQPNALELDLDAITAITVTAYLVGLPLQTWSTTVKSSRIVRYMVLVWNAILFAAAICAMVTWPETNTGPVQYRFCYARFPDDASIQSDGWDKAIWRGSWNDTIYDIFENPGTVWQNLSSNCFYPCFNTSQVLRRSQSLKATMLDSGTKAAKLHDPEHYNDDAFGSLIYILVFLFTACTIILYLAPLLRLCSPVIPVYEPANLWRKRRVLWRHFKEMWQSNIALASHCCQAVRAKLHLTARQEQPEASSKLELRDCWLVSQLFFDTLVVLILLASLTLFPVTVIGFVCWIEWYIWNDGTPSETPNQVGQWSVLVSVVVVLIAATLYQLKDRVASKEELKTEIEKAERHLSRLREYLAEKSE